MRQILGKREGRAWSASLCWMLMTIGYSAKSWIIPRCSSIYQTRNIFNRKFAELEASLSINTSPRISEFPSNCSNIIGKKPVECYENTANCNQQHRYPPYICRRNYTFANKNLFSILYLNEWKRTFLIIKWSFRPKKELAISREKYLRCGVEDLKNGYVSPECHLLQLLPPQN